MQFCVYPMKELLGILINEENRCKENNLAKKYAFEMTDTPFKLVSTRRSDPIFITVI